METNAYFFVFVSVFVFVFAFVYVFAFVFAFVVVFVKTVGYQVVSHKLSVCAVKEAFEEKSAQKSFSLFAAFTEFTTRGNANKGVL